MSGGSLIARKVQIRNVHVVTEPCSILPPVHLVWSVCAFSRELCFLWPWRCCGTGPLIAEGLSCGLVSPSGDHGYFTNSAEIRCRVPPGSLGGKAARICVRRHSCSQEEYSIDAKQLSKQSLHDECVFLLFCADSFFSLTPWSGKQLGPFRDGDARCCHRLN